MAGPKPGGDKQALMDAYKGAQADSGSAAPDASAAPDPSAPPMDDMGGQEQLSADPAMKSLELQVQHLEHILLQKGILSPQDLISPPAPAAEPMAPPGPPMGAPMGAPPAGPPLQ